MLEWCPRKSEHTAKWNDEVNSGIKKLNSIKRSFKRTQTEMKVELKSSISQLENLGKICTSRMDQAEVNEDWKIKLRI